MMNKKGDGADTGFSPLVWILLAVIMLVFAIVVISGTGLLDFARGFGK